jgi:hypothetical protein
MHSPISLTSNDRPETVTQLRGARLSVILATLALVTACSSSDTTTPPFTASSPGTAGSSAGTGTVGNVTAGTGVGAQPALRDLRPRAPQL